jgi:HlyD family secretion protein
MAHSIKKVLARKFLSSAVALVLVVGGYYGYTKYFGATATVRYVTADVARGTLIVSVSGSGQIAALDQVDIKPKVSGDVTYVGAVNGASVRAGALLVQFDTRDAEKTVRDTEISLAQTKINLEKMQGLSTEEGTLRGIKKEAADALAKSYEDGFNTVANAYLDLPGVMAGTYDLLFAKTLGGGTQANIDAYADAVKGYDEAALQYKDDAYRAYQKARASYDKNFVAYKATSRFSDTDTIDALIVETYEAVKDISDVVKSANNLILFYQDKLTERNIKPSTVSDTHLTALNAYTGKTNSHLVNLLSIKNTIQNNKEAIVNSTFDIDDQKILITKAENALADAKEKLADYAVRAPFDGVMAKFNVKRGDTLSSATVVGTLITKQKIAEITLNEVDVAKAAIGQKVTLTFDAIQDFSVSGEVMEIDALGTVSQGVVTYAVTIALDTQDERVKPGMSVSAAIITDVKQNILLVPNSAIKQQNDTEYVEIFISEIQTPRQQTIQVGLSNDTATEVISGITESDAVVTQTITADTAQNQTQQNTGLRIPGLTGGGSGSGFRR